MRGQARLNTTGVLHHIMIRGKDPQFAYCPYNTMEEGSDFEINMCDPSSIVAGPPLLVSTAALTNRIGLFKSHHPDLL